MATSLIYGKSHTILEDPDIWEQMSCFREISYRRVEEQDKLSIMEDNLYCLYLKFASHPTLKSWRFKILY